MLVPAVNQPIAPFLFHAVLSWFGNRFIGLASSYSQRFRRECWAHRFMAWTSEQIGRLLGPTVLNYVHNNNTLISSEYLIKYVFFFKTYTFTRAKVEGKIISNYKAEKPAIMSQDIMINNQASIMFFNENKTSNYMVALYNIGTLLTEQIRRGAKNKHFIWSWKAFYLK